MNWNRMDGDSKHFKGNAKDHRNKTDDQADYLAEARDHLAGRKQEVHGIAKDEGQLFDRISMKKDRAHMGKHKNDKKNT